AVASGPHLVALAVGDHRVRRTVARGQGGDAGQAGAVERAEPPDRTPAGRVATVAARPPGPEPRAADPEHQQPVAVGYRALQFRVLARGRYGDAVPGHAVAGGPRERRPGGGVAVEREHAADQREPGRAGERVDG